jgi:tRNA U34 5-carboxymethylaminomethyl modifying enzyme MnmG/GidA
MAHDFPRGTEMDVDVLVVGGGHAGTEAAVAAARLGARVALVTSALETIGQMSCNPAIGGVAKGTVAREVDALGGIMGRATDLAMLQFRMLNRSKGPAVWAPRAQCDRGLYRRAVRSLLERHERLHTVQGTVARLLLSGEDGRVVGVETLEGRRFGARAVVITTGTFLRGRIHIGTTTRLSGGRAGDAAAVDLAEQLEALGLEVARFKTGTPPRIDGRSVDYARLERQDSEVEAFDYSWSHFWDRPRRGDGRAGAPPRLHDGAESGAARHRSTAGDIESTPDAAPPASRDSLAGAAPSHPIVAADIVPTHAAPPASRDSSARAAGADRRDAGDIEDRAFAAYHLDPSTGGRTRHPAQLPCWITWAGAPVKRIVADNLATSAMYGGAIASRGPRYCPSVEDKIVRFPDVARHQLFLEPEGHDTTELYVNGLSTSLPAEVQLRMLRAVPGLESVRMTRAGYAIEYDYYPPTQLDATLQVKALAGLFFAGQINGTTGYEEAAGQGVIAGINAGRFALGAAPVVLGRQTGYIGVLVDDLVTRGVDEPYRLFTSRSEFRLTVRQDNALRRLAPTARELGLWSPDEERLAASRLGAEDEALALAAGTSIRPAQADPLLAACGSAPLPHAVRVAEVARRQGVSLGELFAATGVGAGLPREALVTAELELKYAGYFERERVQAERLRRLGDIALDPDLAYPEMRSLSFEARQKLAAIRPRSVAQAARIPGVSPTDLQNLVLEIDRRRRAAAATVPGE